MPPSPLNLAGVAGICVLLSKLLGTLSEFLTAALVVISVNGSASIGLPKGKALTTLDDPILSNAEYTDDAVFELFTALPTGCVVSYFITFLIVV